MGSAVLLMGAAAPTPTPLAAGTLPPGIWPRLGHTYTLLDPTLALPPFETMAPDLSLVARELGDEVPPTPQPDSAESTVKWKLDYHHAQLTDLSSADLRGEPATGFARQLDTDVLALGMTWNLAGSRVGLAYQLQSARGNVGDESGLARFLPGSEAATHALTLGITRPFDAGLPPPAPPPLLVLEAPTSEESAGGPTPSPAP